VIYDLQTLFNSCLNPGGPVGSRPVNNTSSEQGLLGLRAICEVARRANAAGLYSQIKPYRKDMYIVVTNMSGYRDSLSDPTLKGYLSLCKGNDVMWQSSIPANSRISVSGNKVFVVFRQRNRIVKWPLRIPARFRQPFGRVSGWYAHP